MCLATAFLLIPLIAQAQQPKAAAPDSRPGKLALTTERVVVFKDGHGLFTKVATATADGEGRVFTEAVPEAAVLGSFWAIAEERAITSMRAEWDERREERTEQTPAITTVEILRASAGKTVTIVYAPGDKDKTAETHTGTLVEVLELPAQKTEPRANGMLHAIPGAVQSPARPGEPPGTIETARWLVPAGGEWIVLESSERGRMVLPVSGIRSVSGKDLGTRITRTKEIIVRSKKLTFDLGKETAGKPVKLRIFYFTPGIRWIPTYRIGGDLKDKADIALQGEILNEEEDIEGAALDLVVGVPSFRFKGTISPLSLEKVLRNALAEAAPQLMGRHDNNYMSNAMFSQRSGERNNNDVDPDGGGDGAMESGEPNLPSELTATAEHDLFVYGVKSFTLKKGGRATVPLWQNAAPVRHLYTLDVPVARNADSTRYASSGPVYAESPLRLQKNQVWHQVELTNPGTMPWTTGAAFLMSGNLPLGQDLLTYTPAGAKSLVPVTVAVDVRGDYEEEEIDRQPNALRSNKEQFTLIRKKGTVSVKNYKKEAVTMRVKVGVGGKATSASDSGKVRIDEFHGPDWQGGSYPALNPHSDVTWELTLKPGETKSVTYQVGYYAR